MGFFARRKIFMRNDKPVSKENAEDRFCPFLGRAAVCLPERQANCKLCQPAKEQCPLEEDKNRHPLLEALWRLSTTWFE